MKCIMLAAGEGVRMRPLTRTTPKTMVLVAGKPLLDHIIFELPDEIDEIILVVGYLHEKIREYFGEQFGRYRIRYVKQEVNKENYGTYRALELAKNFLHEGERFLMMYADDIHGKAGLTECVKCDDMALLVAVVENPRKFGVAEVDRNGNVTDLVEKPENPKTNLASSGAMLLDTEVFKYPVQRNPSGEFCLADSIAIMLAAGHKVKAVKSSLWIPVGYPEDLMRVEEYVKLRRPSAENSGR